MLETILCACFVGAVAETSARVFSLWRYPNPAYIAINIFCMFGLIMAGLSYLMIPLGWAPVFLIATAIGVGYEHLNFSVLNWWYFPNDRFLIFKGKQACALSVGALWGLVPIIVHIVADYTA